MQLDTPIHSGNIVLRTMCPAEASPAYLGWLSDPAINAYLEVRFNPPDSVSELETYIADTNASFDTLLLGIFLADSALHIGNIKLGPIDWNHRVGDLGFFIGDREQWGKGYASKAIALLSDYAFIQLELVKLTAGCYADNEGSRRALQKVGFMEEGRRTIQYAAANSRQDAILLGRVNPRHGIS